MPGKAAIVLGHSHLSSIVLNLNDRPGEVHGGDDSIEYFVFDTIRLGSDFVFSIDSGGGHYVLNPTIMDMVNRKVPSDKERIYVSMFGGNAHNVLTLEEHPVPFDFIIPDKSSLPFLEDAELVTYDYIDRFVRKLAEPYLLNATTLRNATSSDVYHFESPPPVRDNDFIVRNLEDWFKKQTPIKIAPPYLRYKMWHVHSKIIRDFCDQMGINFLSTPVETQDEQGFLLEEHGRDLTHAGPSFGNAILKQLESRLGLKYGGWSWLYD